MALSVFFGGGAEATSTIKNLEHEKARFSSLLIHGPMRNFEKLHEAHDATSAFVSKILSSNSQDCEFLKIICARFAACSPER